MSDYSSLHWFRRMKVVVRESEIRRSILDDLLNRFNMEECKPVQSLLLENTMFERESDRNMTNKA